jgi:hypothetical protein
MFSHRLRRDALHLPARRSRQNANLFMREPLGKGIIQRIQEEPAFSKPRPEKSCTVVQKTKHRLPITIMGSFGGCMKPETNLDLCFQARAPIAKLIPDVREAP